MCTATTDLEKLHLLQIMALQVDHLIISSILLLPTTAV
jgi:hypothetical protein